MKKKEKEKARKQEEKQEEKKKKKKRKGLLDSRLLSLACSPGFCLSLHNPVLSSHSSFSCRSNSYSPAALEKHTRTGREGSELEEGRQSNAQAHPQ